MYKKRNKKIVAFTLAEVLITLGIIGVVAAISIPTLIQNSQEKATVSLLKKAFTTYSQAFQLAVNENGTPDTWDIGDYSSDPTEQAKAKNIITTLAPYLKVTKTCDKLENGCHVSPSWFLNNVQYDFVSNRMYRAALSDGSYLAVYSLRSNCNYVVGSTNSLNQVCAYMIVDINGAKLPNTQGKDIFWFYLTKNGITPLGTASEVDGVGVSQFSKTCKLTADGSGCAAWVIYNENMDYLKCTGLNWGGQTTCN